VALPLWSGWRIGFSKVDIMGHMNMITRMLEKKGRTIEGLLVCLLAVLDCDSGLRSFPNLKIPRCMHAPRKNSIAGKSCTRADGPETAPDSVSLHWTRLFRGWHHACVAS
jgi:hypothetical protein